MTGAATHAADDRDAWPIPVNLFRGMSAPPLTAADVPNVIADFAVPFALAGGFDPTGILASAVVAAAATIDDGIALAMPGASGHFQHARLWAAIVGSPGAGKSPMQKAAIAPVVALHRDLVGEAARLAANAPEGDLTPMPALFTSDCTIDKLSEILAHNSRGILYGVDELDSWLGQQEAYGKEGAGKARGEWLRLFDGGPHQVDRVRRGSYFVKNWGASVLTATTPAALARVAKKLPADGLVQRFLWLVVAPMQARDKTIFTGTIAQARASYDARLRAIYEQTADLVDKPIVRMSPEAAQAFDQAETKLRLLTEAAEAVSDSFASHVAKHVGILGRVALTFHALSDDVLTDDGRQRHPCAAQISGATMKLAVRFMSRCYRHSYIVFTEALGGGTPAEMAKAMARSILVDEMESFNRREITHVCRAFRDASEWQRMSALRALQDLGWIEGETLLPEHGGRWAVNPRVHALYRAERDRAQQRRTAVHMAILGDD